MDVSRHHTPFAPEEAVPLDVEDDVDEQELELEAADPDFSVERWRAAGAKGSQIKALREAFEALDADRRHEEHQALESAPDDEVAERFEAMRFAKSYTTFVDFGDDGEQDADPDGEVEQDDTVLDSEEGDQETGATEKESD